MTVHIIGAGMAGLAAAVALTRSGIDVSLHEAAGQAGGRCRSYFEPALGMTIDNGNHLLLSGNHATMEFTRALDSESRLRGPAETEFEFLDLSSAERWTLKPNPGRVAWWILSARRRAPGTGILDHLAALKLLTAPAGARVGDVMATDTPAFHRLWHPLLLAALNTEPALGSASMAAAVLRETLLKGGRAYRPLVAAEGLAATLVDPALDFLDRHGVPIQFSHRLRRFEFEDRPFSATAPVGDSAVTALDFGAESLVLGRHDQVILAVPPWVAAELVPHLPVPTAHRAIVNGHFAFVPPAGAPPMLGLLGGTAEWLFCFENRLSVTVSAGDRLLDQDRETLARLLWADVAAALHLDPNLLPPWQIVKEKRATFAALPEQERLRPSARTRWENLFLAGDWTDTGLPATIEGAVRSGNLAARLAGATSV